VSLKVRLVSYDETSNWILDKFARRMHECLVRQGVDAEIGGAPDPRADINHHICYAGFDGERRGHDTLMVTHIDDSEKLTALKRQMQTASAGICMSEETVRYLAMMGIPREKLCYVNPAHDGVMPIRKTVVGLACRVQDDGRKRENFLVRLGHRVDPRYFTFRIMGDGWEPQVSDLRSRGFTVDYFEHFDYEEYLRFIPSLDYYLYMGMDEGQMGFIDALAAGVETIVTAQGYHLDAPHGMVYPFKTYEELESVFLGLQEKKRVLTASIASWTWEDYARKHVEIWEYLMDGRRQESKFTDGLNTLRAWRHGEDVDDADFVRSKNQELRATTVSRLVRSQKRWWKEQYANGGIVGIGATILGKVRRRLAKH
jgi:hypothetical protein